MAEVTVALIKELRERTGCGMMDAKRALTEYDGDVDKAIEELRKKGEVKAAKRAGRETAEGKIGIAISDDGKTAAIVAVQCETDFTANNDEFTSLVDSIAKSQLTHDGDANSAPVAGGEGTVEDALKALVAKTGENMTIGKSQRYVIDGAGFFGTYLHSDGKLGVVVNFAGADANSDDDKALAKDVAMHIAAIAPLGLTRDDIDAELVAKEKEIAVEQAKASGKPENIVEKIAEGKINSFFKERTLLEQPFVKDGSVTVEKHVANVNANAKIAAYARIKVGE